MSNTLKKTISNQEGISILELTIAIMILGVCLIPITQAFPYSSAVIGSAKNTAIASYAAQEKIEEIISFDYDDAGIGTVEARTSLGTAESPYLSSYERETVITYVNTDLSESASDTGLKKITVNIYYIDRMSKNEKTFSLNTLLAKK